MTSTLSGSLDFVEEAVDLRFTLIGSGAADAQGLRPELFVLYKGPVSAPRRTVDVSALTSWLTLQSVERESRKLEAEEREAKRREALDALIREATRDLTPAATGATPQAPPPAAVGASPLAPRPSLKRCRRQRQQMRLRQMQILPVRQRLACSRRNCRRRN